MEIGEKIKKLRLEKKISQKELALKIGATQPNIAYFETRGNAITLENAFKIATALEVSIKSLLFDDIDYTDVPNSKEVENLLIAKDKEIENLRNEIERLKKELKGSEKYIELMEKNVELSNKSGTVYLEFLTNSMKAIREEQEEKLEVVTEYINKKNNVVFSYALTITPLKLVDIVKDAINKKVGFDAFIKIFKNYPEIKNKINKEYNRLFGVDE